jgi:hypothetical protein
LPSEGYKHLIFLSDATYSGNLGGFAGADSKCNADVNKPITDANITYKALLNGNGATVLNVDYYTANGSSLIATATGVNLVGYSGLTNPISSINSRVWTGADTNKDCSNWTQGDSTTGSYGISNELGGSYYGGFVQFCSSSAKLYCVAQ